jgi:hypothetical protein
VSGESQSEQYDLAALTDRSLDSGVPHGDLLLRFTDACLGGDEAELSNVRAEVYSELGNDGLVESACIVGTFNQMVRIADASGIPLDAPLDMATAGFRGEIGLEDYGSAVNTPKAGVVKKAMAGAVDAVPGPIRSTLFKTFAKLRDS